MSLDDQTCRFRKLGNIKIRHGPDNPDTKRCQWRRWIGGPDNDPHTSKLHAHGDKAPIPLHPNRTYRNTPRGPTVSNVHPIPYYWAQSPVPTDGGGGKRSDTA